MNSLPDIQGPSQSDFYNGLPLLLHLQPISRSSQHASWHSQPYAFDLIPIQIQLEHTSFWKSSLIIPVHINISFH